jgi:predicted DsbA family dithiol-disulfide isomerase
VTWARAHDNKNAGRGKRYRDIFSPECKNASTAQKIPAIRLADSVVLEKPIITLLENPMTRDPAPRRTPFLLASLLLLLVVSASACKGRDAAKKPTGPQADVALYVMSKCPYGVEAENGLKPALDEIEGRVALHIDFIANQNGGAFSSLHGQTEVDGDLYQLCAMKQAPEARKFMSFIGCQNQDFRNIPGNWEKCAKASGIDTEKLKSCATGDEGKALLAASLQRAKDAHASGSPTIRIGNQPYEGGRGKRDFLRAICDQVPGQKPKACAELPEIVAVNGIIVSDRRCKDCDTAALENQLRRRFFPKLNLRQVDYSETEGKKLYAAAGVKNLPLLLLEPGVEKSDSYSMIARWLEDKAGYKYLKVPAKFDPTAEICDNGIDDNSDGKVDCADSTCSGTMTCRKEIPHSAQVFVMSQCPYGVKALDSMKEVLGNFQDKMDFDVHYIADQAGDGFRSLHGQAEVDEDIRELCAKQHYRAKNKYLDYIWCRNQNVRAADWQSCAKDGIAADVIDKCVTSGEGKALLAADLKIAQELQIGASPTWIGNNKHSFSALAANDIKAQICSFNKDLPNCDKALTVSTKAAGSCN